jgi:L-threonylcarbamoyladenylate synthase
MLKTLNAPKLIESIHSGKVGVIPTDTVYGLVCSAKNKPAVKRLYEIKSREKKPGTVIAANIDQIVDLGIPKRYLTAVEQFWPNPISVIVPDVPEVDYLVIGQTGLAVRIPSDDILRAILEKTGALLTTSANLPGEKTSETIGEAISYFGDKVDFYVDGGDLSGRLPSTVIRVVDDAVDVLREGAVKINEKGAIEP